MNQVIEGPGCRSIIHNDIEYTIDVETNRPSAAECTFIDQIKTASSSRDLLEVYELTGEHIGPPIRIAIKNARLELDGDDDGGTSLELEHDGILWADDLTRFDEDELVDAYLDVVRDDLRQALMDSYHDY